MLNLRQSSRKLLPLLAVLLGTQSCIDTNNFDFENVESATLQPAVALPLLHGNLTIEDLLPKEESSYIYTDNDNLIHVLYSDTIASRSILDHFLLKPLIINEQYLITTSSLFPDNQVVKDEQYLLDLDFSEADFDEITLKTGIVKLAITSTVKADITVKLDFPNLKKNGQTLSLQISLPINTATNIPDINLKDYIIDLHEYGPGENYIPVRVTATASNQQEGVGQISVDLDIKDLEYSLLTGYFGQLDVSLPSDSIQLAVFDNIFSKGNFGLKEPSLSFDFLNSNGAPVQAQIHQFEAKNSAGETIPILTNPANTLTIEAPGTAGEETVSKLVVTNEEEVIKFAPSEIVFRFSGEMNPAGPPATPNFLTDKSRAAVVLNADIPLWGYLEGFTLSDTIPLNIGLENQDEYIQEASIKVVVKNQFPLDATIKIDFVDADNRVLETLFEEGHYNLLPGSTVGANGEIIKSGELNDEIEVSSQKFEKILAAERIIISGTLTTSKINGTFPHVKIKTDQALSINLGVKATANKIVYKFKKDEVEQ